MKRTGRKTKKIIRINKTGSDFFTHFCDSSHNVNHFCSIYFKQNMKKTGRKTKK